MIKCWDEGFAQLKKGEKAVLTCPPDMAYGDRAAGKIPAGSTLKFEVELIDFSIPLTFTVEKHNEGEGTTIPSRSQVKMTYKGYLKDGTVFDENKNSFDF